MAKEKVQRTDWKKQFVLVQEDRNRWLVKCEGLEEEIGQANRDEVTQSRRIDRLENEARETSRRVDEVSSLLHALMTAPEHSSTDGETTNYGRDVVLGRLVEAVKRIPRTIPF